MRHQKHSLHHPSRLPRQAGFRLEQWLRRCLYGTSFLLVVSGVLWLLAHYLLRPVGEFGESIHPLEPWSMKCHGAGAMFMLVLTGGLINAHIRRALKSRRNLVSGWTMIALLSLLAVTGYGLYYLASEQSRVVWSTLHWVVGLAFPVLIVLHIVLGRKALAVVPVTSTLPPT